MAEGLSGESLGSPVELAVHDSGSRHQYLAIRETPEAEGMAGTAEDASP